MTHLLQPSVRVHLVTGGAGRSPRGAELPGLTDLRPRSLADAGPVAGSSVSIRAEGERLVVLLTGDVDLALAGELDGVLVTAGQHCVRYRRARVHVDVREVSAVDASAVRFLERLREVCAARGASCTTSGGRAAVEQVLALARPVADGALAAS